MALVRNDAVKNALMSRLPCHERLDQGVKVVHRSEAMGGDESLISLHSSSVLGVLRWIINKQSCVLIKWQAKTLNSKFNAAMNKTV